MPSIKYTEMRKLQKADSILSVNFYDGEITKTELAGERDMRVTIGDENFLIDKGDAEKFGMKPGSRICGFLVEYSIPDDGATIFYFNDFHPR